MRNNNLTRKNTFRLKLDSTTASSYTSVIFLCLFFASDTMRLPTAAAAILLLAGTTGVGAFSPQLSGHRASMQLYNAEIGAGGMADTRNPDAFEHEDPRKSISAAPSFEEYLKQREAGASSAEVAGVSSAVSASAPAPAPAPQPAAPAPAAGGSASADAAIASLSASQSSSVDKIASTIGPDLELKPDLSWTAETVGGAAATLDGREAPGANGNVAWLANVAIAGKMSSLTIFNGPLTDVPHILSRAVVVDGDKIRFTLDIRPRAYGAYELRGADGSYPGPDVLGRDAFTYSGNRKDYDTKFGTDDVVALVEGIASSLEGAVVNTDEPGEPESLVRGPLYLDVTAKLTDGNVAVISDVRSKIADYWLGWAMDSSHAHRPGAPVNSQYVYDSKYKINAYSALLVEYKSLFGEDGVKLAAAESGPLDEAYVGGGS